MSNEDYQEFVGLITKQQSSYEKIKTLQANYKKDSMSRKSIDYLNKRTEALQALWDEFHSNHEVLKKYETIKRDHDYFKQSIFEVTRSMFNETMQSMNQLRSKLVNEPGFSSASNPMTPEIEITTHFDTTGLHQHIQDEPDRQLTKLLRNQMCNFNALERAVSKTNLDHLKEKWQLQDHLNILQSKWESIDKIHWEIKCLNGLENINVDIPVWGPLIVYLLSSKLDDITYSDYLKIMKHPRELPDLEEFMEFLELQFMTLESSRTKKSGVKHNYSTNNNQHKGYNNNKSMNFKDSEKWTKTYHASLRKCPLCKNDHALMQCPNFISMDVATRNQTTSNLNICKNCLFSHGGNKCNSTKRCRTCNFKHHSLLHDDKLKGQQSRPATSAAAERTTNHINGEQEILLTTLQLKVKNKEGDYIILRALLDQGSQVTLVTENAAQRLNLPRNKMNASVTGIGTTRGTSKGMITLECKSIHSDYTFKTKALVMSKLINNLPNSNIDTKNWTHLHNIKLADPDFNISGPIDLLLGADIYSDVILDGVLKHNSDSPVAQQTKLGWILCGATKHFNCLVTLTELENITKFWEMEEIPAEPKSTTKDEYCEKYYTETTERLSNGRYVLCTLTYGTKAAPFLAMRTLQQLAKDEGNNFSLAKKALENDLYMDDVISGHHTIDTTKLLQKELCKLLKKGGFILRKWSANEPSILKDLKNEQKSHNNEFNFKQQEFSKTLGLAWNDASDTFHFNCEAPDNKKNAAYTKRKLLSEISKIYDPLGWLAPMTIQAKLLFQKLWSEPCQNIGWDEKVPDAIEKQWLKIKFELPNLNNISLPRWINNEYNRIIKLHAFCDASEKAYACVIYSQTTLPTGEYKTTLLAAKTKVAPIKKKTTIPRLELCAAVLLAKLLERTTKILAEYDLRVYCWTDSKIVLAWLQGSQNKYEKYITNRTTQITNIVPAINWGYVKTSENPADCATRGLLPSKLVNFSLWWEGPKWLKEQQNQGLIPTETYTTKEGSLTNCYTTNKTEPTTSKNELIDSLLERHSNIDQYSHGQCVLLMPREKEGQLSALNLHCLK
uniref:SFRICE_032395 n=1 Tax=Spodoptera frugiperda TaxID=7108 RepID=A0A2H1WZP8_SPOFR